MIRFELQIEVLSQGGFLQMVDYALVDNLSTLISVQTRRNGKVRCSFHFGRLENFVLLFSCAGRGACLRFPFVRKDIVLWPDCGLWSRHVPCHCRSMVHIFCDALLLWCVGLNHALIVALVVISCLGVAIVVTIAYVIRRMQLPAYDRIWTGSLIGGKICVSLFPLRYIILL